MIDFYEIRKKKNEKKMKLTNDFKEAILVKIHQAKISEAEFQLAQWEDKSLAHINV